MTRSDSAKATPPGGCTALRFRKAARRVSQIYDEHLAPYGLTITQYGLLAHIRRLDGVSIGELAAELVMDPTTLTRNLGPLVKRDLVAVRPGRRDRRARTLQLTPEGRETLAKSAAGWKAAQRDIASILGDDHGPLSDAIDRMLEKLSE
ncbi:MAG: MarR family winged helix-turn-helix transcriptional regulator [Hyphomicrobiaceae bacterium]|nr:MarR family winged helix-turn-helix transcriptional regulator [Hyphomicrobiaceae bacterium]